MRAALGCVIDSRVRIPQSSLPQVVVLLVNPAVEESLANAQPQRYGTHDGRVQLMARLHGPHDS